MRKTAIIMTILLMFSRFLFAQNIGIGTTAPNEKLHVVGNVKADTVKPAALKLTPNAGAGKILMSDAAGNGGWQNADLAGGNLGFGVWGDCATNGNISEYFPIADTSGDSNENFGTSVSISGYYAIVGSGKDDVGTNMDQGSANFYHYNGSGWVLMQKITDATGAAGDNFGASVSISGNYAMVGSPFDDGIAGADQGSVSIYQFNGSNWVLMQKITDLAPGAEDEFGFSVSISGINAIVGSWGDDGAAGIDQGSVCFYQFNGTNWVLLQKSTDPTGAAGDNFGVSVAISGSYAIVGAFRDDVGANTNQGSVTIYQYNAGTWPLMQKITEPAGEATDEFGRSVAIEGNYLIVGIHSQDVGTSINQGAANIYKFNGSGWSLMQKVTNSAGGMNSTFGISVSINGNYALIGAWADAVAGNIAHGSATIYQRIGLGWQKFQFVVDPGGASGNLFGGAVGLDEATRRFIIGARGYGVGSGKVVFGKIK